MGFTIETFGEMNYRYIALIRDGTRKIMRLGWDGMRKPGFARIALCSSDATAPRWEYPPTFLMHRETGLWISRVVPRMEEKVSRPNWPHALCGNKGRPKSGDEDRKAGSISVQDEGANPTIPANGKKMYPAGKPLRLEERETSKQHRPKSTASSEYL